MKGKNGFTLVELLAVIAIMSILVLIALPNIMTMFNKAKENSFKTELKTIYKVANQTWMNDSMYETSEQIYSRCESCTGKSLDLTGRNEIDYYIKVNQAGKIVVFIATDGTYQFIYNSSVGLELADIKEVTHIASISGERIIIIEHNGVVTYQFIY